MSDTNDKPNPADLPETFTIEELEATFDPTEIAQMRKDDPEMFAPATPDGDEGADDQTAAADAATKAAADTKVTEEVADDRPKLVDVPDTTAAEARVKAAKVDRAALRERYDNGEMTGAELDAALDKLAEEQAAAAAEVMRATEAIKANQKTANDSWLESLEKFKAQGNDALFGDDHAAGFDKALRAVTGDPDNAALPYSTMIQMAAQQHAVAYQARTGKALEVKMASGKAAPRTGEEARRGPRQDQRPDPVETLSNLNAPGADMVADSRFAAIDRIADRDPLAAEEAFAKMSPEEQERYLEFGI